MYCSIQTEVLSQFSFYDVYFNAFFNKLQGFFTFNKTVVIHRILESTSGGIGIEPYAAFVNLFKVVTQFIVEFKVVCF